MHHHGTPIPDILPSSPVAASSSSPANPFLSPTRTSRRKEKRNPSVTPRRFGRFFTPRSSLPPQHRITLGRLNDAATNRQMISPESLASDPLSSDPVCPSSPTEAALGHVDSNGEKRKRPGHPESVIKRRRGLIPDGMAPPRLRLPPRSFHMSRDGEVQMVESPSEERPGLDDKRKATLSQFFKASRSGSIAGLEEKSLRAEPSIVPAELRTSSALEGYVPKPIRKLRNRGFEAHLLDREHGFASHTGRQHLSFPAADSRTNTASFYSRSCDVHHCTSYSNQGNTIPFSLASCRKAPVTAIGDEQGFVRLFNTTTSEGPVDSKVDVHVKVHDNAIMDLDFSQDDLRLATACGDRTGKIMDVVTQTVAADLDGGHWDSLRQISFQPGQNNGSALATSDRAGRIQIWDLRCSPMPVNCFSTRAGLFGSGNRDTSLDPIAAKTINTIDNAHERKVQGTKSSASVTAIQWMPAGREHLLLTASEANASIKLWDTRYVKPRRQLDETPLAVTPQPITHAWRSYGITSMALNYDASRLYAVCKDSTVYAYSTAHLMLGHAPELVNGATKRKPNGAEGLGPLYGFKHDFFRAQSFYVKCSIRAPSHNQPEELLAVGSSDSCAMLFPTDERYMRTAWARRSHDLSASSSSSAFTPAVATPSQSFAATPSGMTPSSSPIPIFRSGTPLIRGHSREVTTLSWSYDGKLVTASDDYIVRQWQSGGDQARHLRQVGEFGGERHMAGWADVAEDWDEDDEE